MDTEQLRWLDATAQAELIRSGEATAVEVSEAAISRIEMLDERLNAVNIRWFDDALTDAADIDRRRAAGEALPRFAGVPTLIKDLWAHCAGHPQTFGNRALAHAMPVSDHNTGLVQRFIDAGLVSLGRTTSPELGSLPVTEAVAFGPTRNPWNTDHTPGGSSGGAAAAVASGMVPVAHASDGGGSIRIPASCCGLIGLKPSGGRISMGPERDESGVSVHFAVTRSMRDTASLLDEVAGPAPGDSVIAPAPARPFAAEVGAAPGRLRIGLLAAHPHGDHLDPECAAAARALATRLEQLGHDVSEAHPPALSDRSFTQQFMAVWSTNMAVSIKTLGTILGRPLEEHEVEPVNWAMGRFASEFTAADYAAGMSAINQFRRSVRSWWADGWDLLLTPTLAEPPVPIGEHDPVGEDPMSPMQRATRFVPFTPPFNTTAQPAISMPTHVSDSGLPIGTQLVADYGREDVLIRVASQLEADGAFTLPNASTIGA